MNNFGRALRLALRYRLTLAGAIVSALAVALLWGGNITAIYPVVEVVLSADRESQHADHRAQALATAGQSARRCTAPPPAAESADASSSFPHHAPPSSAHISVSAIAS